MKNSFVHLRAHSDYSFLRAMATPQKLVQFASKLGMPGIALTDFGNMFGIMEFYLAAQQLNKNSPQKKVNAIIGIDFYFCPANAGKAGESVSAAKQNAAGPAFNYRTQLPFGVYKLPAICENLQGYKNLCKLSNLSYKNMVAGLPCINMQHILENNEGIIFLSGGYGGFVNEQLLEAAQNTSGNGWRAASGFVKQMAALKNTPELLAKNMPGFFLELQKNNFPSEEIINSNLQTLGKKYNVPLVATSEIFYLEKTQWETHEVFLAIGARAQMDMPRGFSNSSRPRLVGTNYYFKTAQEMHSQFSAMPQALENTVLISKRCNVHIVDETVHMPNFLSKKKSGVTAKDELESSDNFKQLQHVSLVEQTQDGLASFNIDESKLPLYNRRIEEELSLIKNTGFSGYFLIVSDIIQAAKEKGILVGPGRGSVVGSLVSYCLGITTVDPVRYDLLFERFLTAERVSLPDIDIDFQDDQREQVIEYVKEKYGKEQVCQIVTFARLKAKAVFKDVARVFGVDFQLANELSSSILTYNSPELVGKKEEEIKDKSWLELSYNYSFNFKTSVDNSSILQNVYRHALQLENLARQSGIHAAGVVISDKPIYSYVPIAKSEGDVVVSQYDGRYLEEKCGLLKMDFLGLRTLTTVRQTLAAIEENFKKTINLNEISTEDKRTYKLFSGGKTMGIFQFESPGMTRYVQELQPSKLEELIAMNALFRPGPMGWIPVYIANKKNKKPVFASSEDEKKYKKLVALSKKSTIIESILKPTQHIPIYQEQVMQISKGFAGFSSAEADNLRSAISKKKKDKIDAIRKQFVSRAVKLGHDEKDAVFIYNDVIESFGSYGFNKSHSASYAYLAYQVAYLKANYPAEFFANYLNNELNSLSAIGKFKRIVSECLEFSVSLTLPDVNHSLAFFKALPGKIMFGLAAIKGVGVGMAKQIQREREKNGSYTGIANFISRLKDTASFNKQVVENIIKTGGFNRCLLKNFNTSFACDQLIHIFPQLFDRMEKDKNLLRGGQMSFFQKKPTNSSKVNSSSYEDGDLLEKAKNVSSNIETCRSYEKEALGFLFSYDYSLKYSALIVELNRQLCSGGSKSIPKDAKDFFKNKQLNKIYYNYLASIIEGLFSIKEEKNFRIACVIETVKEVFTKKDNKPMGIITASVGFPFFGNTTIEFLCFNTTWKSIRKKEINNKSMVVSGQLLIVECKGMRQQEGRTKTFSFEDCIPFQPPSNVLENNNETNNKPESITPIGNMHVSAKQKSSKKQIITEVAENKNSNSAASLQETNVNKKNTLENLKNAPLVNNITSANNIASINDEASLRQQTNDSNSFQQNEISTITTSVHTSPISSAGMQKMQPGANVQESNKLAMSESAFKAQLEKNSQLEKTQKQTFNDANTGADARALRIEINNPSAMTKENYILLKKVLQKFPGNTMVYLCETFNSKKYVFSCGSNYKISYSENFKKNVLQLPFILKIVLNPLKVRTVKNI